MKPLLPGTPFPEMTVTVVGGRTMQLPGELEGDFAALLFYRAHW